MLYLDGDIIVRHSLLPLWNTDLKDYAVGAVPDYLDGDIEQYHRLNYPPELGYFNAGVLLINMDYWREHDVVRNFMHIIQEYGERLLFGDQDILNVVFSNYKVILPVKYNLASGFLEKSPKYDFKKYENEIEEALKDPVIVHYIWPDKPWKFSRQPKHPFSSTFFKYQRQTKWKGVIIDKRPFKLRVINYVAVFLRKYGLKSQIPPLYEYVDIAPID